MTPLIRNRSITWDDARVDFLSVAHLTWQAEIPANQVAETDLASAWRIFGDSFERRLGMNPRRILGLTLVLVAIGVAIALRSSADNKAKPGDVNESRVMSDAAIGNNWLLNGRTFDATHFSPLQQITDKNIGGLGLAWSLDMDSAMGVVSEPIVVDGVIYVSAPLSKVYAVQAATGKTAVEIRSPKFAWTRLSTVPTPRASMAAWPFGTAKCMSAHSNGRLPPGGHRRRNRKESVGSHGLRTNANRHHRRTACRKGENSDGLQWLG